MSFPAPEYPRHGEVWRQVAAALVPGELAHDRYHIERVYCWALRLSSEAGVNPDLAGAAALVHDLAVVPKDSPERAAGGERSALLAGPVLSAAGYDPAEVTAIQGAVATSSWSRALPPHDALAALLQDSDRLDALGAIGMLRACACAQTMSLPSRPGRFYDPDDPLAESGRALDDRGNAIDHCFAKLLRLAAGMHLPSARQEAQRRHAALVAFLAALGREVGG